MNNIRLKVLFLALASASVTSFADVNLYGKVAVGLENDQFQNNTIPGGGSVQDYGSYFGIRGTDPVYGETAVIWQVEQYLDIASGQSYYNTTGGGMIVPNPSSPTNFSGYVKNDTNTLASSETYLGLQGGWGRVRMGNLSNFMRSNMGNTDMFNYDNGVNGLGNFSRTAKLVSTALRYDSPTVAGFNLVALYGFNTNGTTDLTGVTTSNNFGGGLNGVYSGGIMSFGINWAYGNWSAGLGTMIWQQVGNYSTSWSGLTSCSDSDSSSATCYTNATYSNAYANRLEVGYNDPDGLIANAGFQTTSGLAWNSWANSGGTLGVTYNPGFQGAATQLNDNSQLQTQEAALSLGYHIGPWTPKIGYAYGSNLMYGGNAWSVATGNASQVGDSGYQQVVAELDWNITPRTIAFVGYGQVWYGQTLSNVSFGPTTNNGNATEGDNITGGQAYLENQSSFAVGFSHTF